MSVTEYVKCVFKKELIPVLVLVLYYGIVIHLGDNGIRFIFSIPLGILIFIGSIYWLGGVTSEEKEVIKGMFKKLKCLSK